MSGQSCLVRRLQCSAAQCSSAVQCSAVVQWPWQVSMLGPLPDQKTSIHSLLQGMEAQVQCGAAQWMTARAL
jgi:hypothetical protein